MSDEVELSIRDTATKAVLVDTQTLRLPVEVGRFGADNVGRISAGDGRVVHFGDGFGTLSRQHLTIVAGPGGGLVVTDTSSNGVSQLGQAGSTPVALGRGGMVRMAPGAMPPANRLPMTRSAPVRNDSRNGSRSSSA